jgi:hypothetical protein
MTGWADWHLVEVVEAHEVHNYNAYRTAIAKARVQKLFDKTIYLASEHHTGNYPGIVVNLVGDMVSGGLHPELLKTDELEVIPAALKAIDWIVTGLTRIKGRFGKVYVPAVCGNHGRNTAKPEFKRYAKKNLDYLISRIVERHFADDPDRRHSRFQRRALSRLWSSLPAQSRRHAWGERRRRYHRRNRPDHARRDQTERSECSARARVRHQHHGALASRAVGQSIQRQRSRLYLKGRNQGAVGVPQSVAGGTPTQASRGAHGGRGCPAAKRQTIEERQRSWGHQLPSSVELPSSRRPSAAVTTYSARACSV